MKTVVVVLVLELMVVTGFDMGLLSNLPDLSNHAEGGFQLGGHKIEEGIPALCAAAEALSDLLAKGGFQLDGQKIDGIPALSEAAATLSRLPAEGGFQVGGHTIEGIPALAEAAAAFIEGIPALCAAYKAAKAAAKAAAAAFGSKLPLTSKNFRCL